MFDLTEQIYKGELEPPKNSKENLAFQLKKIKVPVFVLNMVGTNKSLNKLYSTYLAFKAFAPSGEILNYTTNAANIAALFGISRATLQARVKQLIKLGLIVPTLKHLTIKPYKALYALHPLETTKYCYVKIKHSVCLHYQIRATALKKNLEAQAHRVVKLIARFDDVTTSQAQTLLGVYKERAENAFRNNKPALVLPPCNLDIALSQRGIADIYGRKSQVSGHYWQQRLQALRLITVSNRIITSYERTREKDKPRFGMWKYNQAEHVSFLVLPNALAFAD